MYLEAGFVPAPLTGSALTDDEMKCWVALAELGLPVRLADLDSRELDGFEQHMLLLVAGHRKRGTRVVHLVTTSSSVGALLFAAHSASGVPLRLT